MHQYRSQIAGAFTAGKFPFGSIQSAMQSKPVCEPSGIKRRNIFLLLFPLFRLLMATKIQPAAAGDNHSNYRLCFNRIFMLQGFVAVGHKGQSVTKIVYTHFEIQELIEAINKI
ncbi:MAG: hypothetical protein LUD07_12995 [Clostridiales bacterium]|nr:hypothetical protein [Clostridiales bacterium]